MRAQCFERQRPKYKGAVRGRLAVSEDEPASEALEGGDLAEAEMCLAGVPASETASQMW